MVAISDVRTAFPEYADPVAFPDATIQGWIAQDAALRIALPEFASTTLYPDLVVVYWIAVGSQQLNASLFGNSYSLALRLFAAHNVVLAAQAARLATAGTIVGGPDSMVASKSVGNVSVSYDTRDSSIAGAGSIGTTRVMGSAIL